jgi:hypothetical protein
LRPEPADYAKKGDYFFHRFFLSPLPKVHPLADISLRGMRGFQYCSGYLYLFSVLQFYFAQRNTPPRIYFTEASCRIVHYILFDQFSYWFYVESPHRFSRFKPSWQGSAFPLFPACINLRYPELFFHPPFRGTLSSVSHCLQNYHNCHCSFIQLSHTEKFYFQSRELKAQDIGRNSGALLLGG